MSLESHALILILATSLQNTSQMIKKKKKKKEAQRLSNVTHGLATTMRIQKKIIENFQLRLALSR